MSDEVRGRVMIINIRTIVQGTIHRERKGSDADYTNLSNLFSNLSFDIVKTPEELTNLTAQVCFY